MVRVVQHSGTTVMAREKIKQMPISTLVKTLMEELQTSIKLSQNQLALSLTMEKIQLQQITVKALL